MKNTQAVIAQSFRATLLAEPTVTALVSTRIFWERVEQGIPFPYITTHHISGGDENKAQTRYADSIWKVQAHTDNLETVTALASAIYTALVGKHAVDTLFALSYATIEEKLPIFDSYQVQNFVIHQVGGMYRIRLKLLEV
jgi:hypothetical protein